MKQNTSVQWLWLKDGALTIDYLEGKLSQIELAIEKTRCIEKANQMHREEIENAFAKGQESMQFKFPLTKESYYDEIYGGGDE